MNEIYVLLFKVECCAYCRLIDACVHSKHITVFTVSSVDVCDTCTINFLLFHSGSDQPCAQLGPCL